VPAESADRAATADRAREADDADRGDSRGREERRARRASGRVSLFRTARMSAVIDSLDLNLKTSRTELVTKQLAHIFETCRRAVHNVHSVDEESVLMCREAEATGMAARHLVAKAAPFESLQQLHITLSLATAQIEQNRQALAERKKEIEKLKTATTVVEAELAQREASRVPTLTVADLDLRDLVTKVQQLLPVISCSVERLVAATLVA